MPLNDVLFQKCKSVRRVASRKNYLQDAQRGPMGAEDERKPRIEPDSELVSN